MGNAPCLPCRKELYYVKTKDLQDRKHLLSGEILKTIPKVCNYAIDFRVEKGTLKSSLGTVYRSFQPCDVILEYHLRMENVVEECYVGFTKENSGKLDRMLTHSQTP